MLKFVFALLFVSMLLSCGSPHEADLDAFANKTQKVSMPADSPEITFNVSYEGVRSGSFWFSDATSFVFDVTGCASGFEKNDHDTASDGASIKLYKGDRDCVAELQSFDWNGKTWTQEGGGNYSGTDPVIFTNIDDEEVSVVSSGNLPSPLVNNSTVSFYFSLAESGSAQQILSSGASNYSPNGGVDAPYYRVRSTGGVTLEEISSPANIATFTFQLECLGGLASANTVCLSQTAENHDQVDMRVALIKDVYDGSMTRLELQTAMGAVGGGSVKFVTAPDILPAAAGFLGGFQVELDGPEDLTSSKKMVLIIEKTDPVPALRTYTYMTVQFAPGAALFISPPQVR